VAHVTPVGKSLDSMESDKKVHLLGNWVVLDQGIATAVHYVHEDTNQAFSKEIKEVYGFVESSVEPSARISFHKPRLMRYVTGAEVFKVATDIANISSDEPQNSKRFQLESAKKQLKAKRINYWILPNQSGSSNWPLKVARNGVIDFPVVFKNAQFVVYSVR